MTGTHLQAHALFDFISGLPNMTSPFLLNYKQSIIQHNHRLLEIFGSDTNTADVEVIEKKFKSLSITWVPYIHIHKRKVYLSFSKDIEEPTELLTRYSRKFLIGRPLDLQDPGEYLEGETNEIFVGRNSIFIDGSNEILAIQNVRYPLNVTFYGEEAEDLGGPRREFFELYINYFKENVLDTDENSVKLKKITSVLVQRHYWAAGIISVYRTMCIKTLTSSKVSNIMCGLSAIQGGPCPTFLMGIVESTDTSECYTQFRQGLDQTGLLTFIQKKPTLGYLFTPSNRVTLTVARLLGMLKPNFSDAGSNDRMHQEESYSHFVKYVREIAGRRNISLPDILRFCTGLTSEPVLGFSIQPTVDFIELPGNLPSASTCINVLNLPVNTGMEQKALFEKFDLAFSNQYFGLYSKFI
ncbi:hypothetical protein KUTeg_002445 [Tegillarca granosa]|uniref:HECT domain-containing protein n=1 Tax=Tegillarca granosa TaxID=220873 RepID=A0ABQ9FUD3_TEGGR|nr:hypothetical protein KUTeg_002445 [Tegillarca granosa]